MNLLPTTRHTRPLLPSALVAAICLSLAACGGGGTDEVAMADDVDTSVSVDVRESAQAVASSNTLHVGIKIPGFPHPVDVYRPAGATRAMVFLHGHGGRSWLSAYDLGINKKQVIPVSKNVNWDWLSRNGIIAVFPQGQALPGSGLPTWSNYVMNSGQDDVAFLKALSSYVKAQYGAIEVSLGGHSSGGVMTGRMWCEATTSFKAFVSLAGPMVSSTYPLPSATCTPLAPAPYLAVFGGKDTKLPVFFAGFTQPTPEQVAAGLGDMVLASEWMRHQSRTFLVCGEFPSLTSSNWSAAGPTWNSCGSRIRYFAVENADHPVPSLDANAGIKMVDLMASFMR